VMRQPHGSGERPWCGRVGESGREGLALFTNCQAPDAI
jgi:hypothetical protein